ncbi:MAG: SCO family protein [Verrucomicrobiota bacterium]
MKTPTILLAAALAWSIAGAAPAPERNSSPDLPACCSKTLAPATFTDKSLYQIDSIWTTDEAKPIRLGALRGKPQVVIMFFSSCQYTCPILVNDLKRIASALPEALRTNVGFTLISFDSERDTPEALHAMRIERDLPKADWTLLRGEPDNVRELAALLGVNYRKDASGQFAHSNLITVLNAEGEIVFQQPGLNLPTDGVIEKLKTMNSQ